MNMSSKEQALIRSRNMGIEGSLSSSGIMGKKEFESVGMYSGKMRLSGESLPQCQRPVVETLLQSWVALEGESRYCETRNQKKAQLL
jgi:hypothetical protein